MNYTPEQKACWDHAMELLKENLGTPSYNAWFKPLSLYAIVGDRMLILSQNSFTLQHMRNRYSAVLLTALDTVFKHKYELEFYTEDQMDKLIDALNTSTLNDRYTFENFVVSSSNQFAYAAAVAVAEEPSEVYNPLFIYGGVGLGKTHLMNAIGNFIIRTNPGMNVLLMTSETITNELIDAIARKKTGELRGKLRNVDVLLVDDIQFLAKTKATQEEFFHTFNDLHGRRKQIIMTADRPPKDMPEIEDRLRSRFEWGLIVDVQRPDYETRVAILKQKAREEGIDVPDEVLEYISQNVSSNVRELEGCLTSLNAHSRLMGTPITVELARSALNHIFKEQQERHINAELIIQVVARKFDLCTEDMIGKRRSREIAVPRQIAMYLCREMLQMSTNAIGQAFGNRDHTTVMHGCDKISELVASDYAMKRQVEELRKLVEGD